MMKLLRDAAHTHIMIGKIICMPSKKMIIAERKGNMIKIKSVKKNIETGRFSQLIIYRKEEISEG